MRTVIFCLLLTIGCSTFAASQGLRASAQKSPQNAKTVEQQTAQGQQSAMNQPHGRSMLPKASHPLPLPKNEIHRATPNTTQARSAGVTKSANIASEGLSKMQATSNLRSVQLHAAPRSPQSPSNMHHRSPNPAILSGSTSPSAANTGALNGTHMTRRP
jgi:hypothetical protein